MASSLRTPSSGMSSRSSNRMHSSSTHCTARQLLPPFSVFKELFLAGVQPYAIIDAQRHKDYMDHMDGENGGFVNERNTKAALLKVADPQLGPPWEEERR